MGSSTMAFVRRAREKKWKTRGSSRRFLLAGIYIRAWEYVLPPCFPIRTFLYFLQFGHFSYLSVFRYCDVSAKHVKIFISTVIDTFLCTYLLYYFLRICPSYKRYWFNSSLSLFFSSLKESNFFYLILFFSSLFISAIISFFYINIYLHYFNDTFYSLIVHFIL